MTLEDVALSAYGAASVAPAPVSRMMADFARGFRPGTDINLGVGYVNEDTIATAYIEEGVRAVLAEPEKYQHALNYGEAKGSANLIRSIREFLLQRGVGGLTAELLDRREIIIGSSGVTSLLEAVAHVLAPGVVLTCDPMYYIYSHYLERQGFEVVAVPEDEEGIGVAALREKIEELGARKKDVRFVYVVSVNNPSCTILSNSRRTQLVGLVTELSKDLGRKIPLFIDKAYEDLVHDPAVEPLRSGLHDDEIGIVYELASLSKVLAPALRIGYMIGPSGPFLQAMIQKISDVGFSAPLITQEVGSYILDHHAAKQIEAVKAGYRRKALESKNWITENLGYVLADCRGGSAGFYYYLTLRGIETHEASPFFGFLTRTTGRADIDGAPEARKPRVFYLPGEFCIHPQGDIVELGRHQLRLSYGYEESGQIERALRLMKEAAAYAREVG